MRLLERDAPLAILHGLQHESLAAGRLVFLEGEAGVGKTSLLRAFRDSLSPGVRYVFGACDPLSTPQPLGPLLEIAPELDPDVARLLDAGAPRPDLLRAFLGALRPLPGVVVVLDDLHWADEATLDVLRFVGRRIQSTTALVVGAYRDDEVARDHPLRVAIGDLATSPAVRRIQLHGLSLGSVAELADGSDLDPAELHARTGGNPFYVTEVIAGAPARIPPTVRDAVLARAARLSPVGRATLEAAAVIGPTIEPALLARVVDGPAADEVLAKGLLLAADHVYAFRHDVARQAVLDATEPGRRRELHARVLAALEAGDAADRPLALLAHHAAEAVDRDAVLRYGRLAASEASAAGAHREAAAQLVRVEPYAASLPEPERASFFEALGHETFVMASGDLGRRALEEAIDLWRRLGDAAREIHVQVELARAAEAGGNSADALAALERAAELGEPLPPGPAKVESLMAQALWRVKLADFPGAIESGRAAVALGGRDPDAVSPVVLALQFVGLSRITLDDLGGIDDMLEAFRLGVEHGVDRNAARAYVDLTDTLVETHHFRDAELHFDAGLRFTIDRELDSQRLYIESVLAIALVERGRWSEAGDIAATVLAQSSNTVISRINALYAVGLLRTRRGDPDAQAALDEGLSLGREARGYQARLRAARAELAWLGGDHARVAAEAEAGLPHGIDRRQVWSVGALVWWLQLVGRRPPEIPLDLPEPWQLQLDGRWRKAAAAWRDRDCPYHAGRALLASEDPADVEEARAIFDRLGARPALGLATKRLRELGVRSIPRGARPATRANKAGLTARELEILRLVAAGQSNEQIAARLYLSRRTIHHHVAAILGKLEVNRRGDARSAARELGIDLEAVPPD
jgi:DNA-binding CsgD family transcriptional regulator